MAQVWCTGPVHVFVAIQSPLPVYLGTGESAPDIDINAEWEAVWNDISGNKVPFDELYESEWATASVVLTRWNEPVITLLQARPKSVTGQSVRGQIKKGDIGTVMQQEGFNHSLFLQFPYSTKPAMAGMPAGYRFPAAKLAGPERLKSGTVARKIHLFWKALPAYSPLAGDFLLYDNNIAGIPTPD